MVDSINNLGDFSVWVSKDKKKISALDLELELQVLLVAKQYFELPAPIINGCPQARQLTLKQEL